MIHILAQANATSRDDGTSVILLICYAGIGLMLWRSRIRKY